MANYPLLESIHSPEDLKQLPAKVLPQLAEESRGFLIQNVTQTGGHLASNLGVVELTVMLHYVFNLPTDKLLFDVSHQCYSHKILTGRKDGFVDSNNYLKYTGYTAPEECEHDLFKIGHTSTSVSLACGVAKARDLKGEKNND